MSSVAQGSPKDYSKPVFFGFLFVGFLSLLGGIAMFVYVVPKDMNPADVPRDVSVLFTGVFSEQMRIHSEIKRFAAALSEVGVDRDTCDRYRCRLTVPPNGDDYFFRLSKNGHTWVLRPSGPVPKLVL